MSTFQTIRFPIVWNPKTNEVCVDDPARKQPLYDIPLMNVGNYMASIGQPGGSKAASVQATKLEDIFFNNGKEEYNFYDKAVEYYDNVIAAQTEENRAVRESKAAAIITSLDYADFHNTIIVGSSTQTAIKTGILVGQFEEISLPNLSGKWASFDDDVKWHTNLPEGKSPEPSSGTGTVVDITIQKHGGAVAKTDMSDLVINGDNPFQRLVSKLQDKRQESENAMVAAEIEGNTAHSQSGVDFGLRSGTPPVSQTNPGDLITTLIGISEGLAQPFNLFVSKGFIYNEAILNDILRGAPLSPLPTQSTINEQSSAFPALGGVTWVRDNAISSSTAGWIMNSDAIKNFRGPVRAYTVADPDAETTKYVTKNYYKPETVDGTLIYRVTGIAA